MERIVNLQYKCYPNLFKYILKNKRDIVLDRWKLLYIHVKESEIEKLANVKGQEGEVRKVLNAAICPKCGTRITGGFLLSYRGQECIGRSIECPICYLMSDSTFYKVMNLHEEDKYIFVKDFLSKIQ
ncbi:hypothetical protein NE686_17605 [Tissierella carlieri]|uniref:Uncharacterized protein n=1 Tax=Tissierella carlieri TaxID=689904 RepID=A0ABT1SEX2_9FIRM|nr:hypothetical protein [Tissierella carlieri]MCQ4924922.1 hypothetical protein [Tissierella carlieri]